MGLDALFTVDFWYVGGGRRAGPKVRMPILGMTSHNANLVPNMHSLFKKLYCPGHFLWTERFTLMIDVGDGANSEGVHAEFWA